jgi:hypothetical protein
MGQAAGASTATLSSATPTLLAGLKQLRDDIERCSKTYPLRVPLVTAASTGGVTLLHRCVCRYGVEFPDVEGPDRLLKRAKKVRRPLVLKAPGWFSTLWVPVLRLSVRLSVHAPASHLTATVRGGV